MYDAKNHEKLTLRKDLNNQYLIFGGNDARYKIFF